MPEKMKLPGARRFLSRPRQGELDHVEVCEAIPYSCKRLKGTSARNPRSVDVIHHDMSAFQFFVEKADEWLFTENETNARRLFGEDVEEYFKDAFHECREWKCRRNKSRTHRDQGRRPSRSQRFSGWLPSTARLPAGHFRKRSVRDLR